MRAGTGRRSRRCEGRGARLYAPSGGNDVDGRHPCVDVNVDTGEGVLLYSRGGATYVRSIAVD